MPFTSVKRRNSCLPVCQRWDSAKQDLETEGIIEHRHFRRVHQTSLHTNSTPNLSCPAGMSQTQLAHFAHTPLPTFAELMWRIEDAPKNQSSPCSTQWNVRQARKR